MVSIKFLVAILAIGLASAAPTDTVANTSALGKRQSAVQVMYCINTDFNDCQIHNGWLDTCYDVVSRFRNQISSYQNLREGTKCRWFENTGCTGRYYEPFSDPDLHDGDGSWADRIESLRCTR
ncbi:hypothetical protein OQA88_7674 [Cercophora sp. LCS_1]